MKKKYNLSIVGQSNTGKSSLINYLSGMNVTTESHRLQTTRINLYHSVTLNGLEINIIDTPGISLVNNDLLSESMKNAYIKTLSSIDLILIVLDINNKDLKYEESIMNLIDSVKKNALIVVNKIDLAEDDLVNLQNLKDKLNHFVIKNKMGKCLVNNLFIC